MRTGSYNNKLNVFQDSDQWTQCYEIISLKPTFYFQFWVNPHKALLPAIYFYCVIRKFKH